MKFHAAFALVVLTLVGVTSADAQPAANTIEAHLAAAKRAAGFDFPGLLAAICVAPRNAPTPDVVMGEGDWEMIEQSVNRFPNGKPKRDIVAMDGQQITLGGRSVMLVLMPGHTPGTVSMMFQVKDNGVPLTVAFSGGTEFNFVNDVPHFGTYINSARKFAAAAAAAGATVLMTNQSEFDGAASKIRMLATRRSGEPHPFDLCGDAVQRYFKVSDECAQVARLKLL